MVNLNLYRLLLLKREFLKDKAEILLLFGDTEEHLKTLLEIDDLNEEIEPYRLKWKELVLLVIMEN